MKEANYNAPHIDIGYCGCGVYKYRGLISNVYSADGQVITIDEPGLYLNLEIECKKGGESFGSLEDIVDTDLPDRCNPNAPLDLLVAAVGNDLYTLTLENTVQEALGLLELPENYTKEGEVKDEEDIE